MAADVGGEVCCRGVGCEEGGVCFSCCNGRDDVAENWGME